jgi:membrane-anchored protein YejM (alkaline phosphatase superfamily)
MKPNDLVSRNQKTVSTENGNITCEDVSPGPLQHGFSEYVAMAEGPSSPRLTSLIPKSLLYHQGAKHLVRNDHEYFPTDEILTDRQASEAIRIMNETVQRGQNFFMQLWFDAPHGPWETIQPFDQLYASNLWEGPESRNFKYATMVSSLDHNVGRVRRALVDLGVENNTVVVFLSDNGPEGGAGSAGPFQGGKRSLREGGIRVPCIWQWPNRITANSTSAAFALSTDLFPTFMDAAGITRPEGLKLDGVSLLPILMDSEHSVQSDDRTVTWYKDIDGSSSAAWANGFKFLVDERGDF